MGIWKAFFRTKLLPLLGLSLLGLISLVPSAHAQYAQGKGWAFIQSSPLNTTGGCTGNVSQCSILSGVISPTVAGSVWLIHVQTPNNITITSVTGGGATWTCNPAIHVTGQFTSNVCYGLGGTAGTTNGITFHLSSGSGTFVSANFIEFSPPPGSTASFDTFSTGAPTNCTNCTLPSITVSSTDFVWTNPGGASTATWNSCTSPYVTIWNGDCYVANATGTITGTKTFTGTSNPNFIAIAFKSNAINLALPTPLYSVRQYSAVGVTNCSPNCTITVPQATGTGNLLYLVAQTSGAFISGLPAGWTIPASNACAVSGTIISQGNGLSCAYRLSSTAVSSIAVTMSGSASTHFAFWEITAPAGWIWTNDGNAKQVNTNDGSNTPANFFNNGVSFTPSATNKDSVVFQNNITVGGSDGPSFYPMPNVAFNMALDIGPANYFALNEAASTVLLDVGTTVPVPVWLNPQHDTTLANGSIFFAAPPTVNLADCNSATVTGAIAAITVDQTVLQCPGGTFVWNANGGTTLQNSNFGYHLNGTTTVAGTCAPGGTCTPTDGTIIQLSTANHSNGSACDTQGNGGGCTNVTLNLTTNKQVEISGIAWQSTTAFPGYGKIAINGNGSCLFRFDHNHINDNTSGDHFINIDNTCGVIDHNFFDSTSFVDTFFIQPTKNGSDGNANAAWTQPENFGSANFLFIENNQFQDGWFVDDCNYGAFMTLRFNIVGTNTSLQSHGVGSGAQRRGCRAMETYENSFAFSTSPSGSCTGGGHGQAPGGCSVSTYAFAFLEDYETGTGMWWGNSVKGFQTFLRQQNVRSNAQTYTQTPTPNGWGFCGTNFNGTGSPWDSNSVAGTGYPCLDQIGYGAGDLLTGVFACPSCTPPTSATLTNSATGCLVGTFGSSCSGYPRQARVPTYAWSNTVTPLSPVPTGGNNYWQLLGGQSTESSDYYLERPNENNAATFDGTGGVGCGPVSSPTCSNPVARPATCTPGVAYWNVNEGSWNQSGSGGQGALDKCTSANTWTNAVYVPYTYPHPLVSGTTQIVGCGAFTDESQCGNVGDAYEGNGPPPGQIPISSCITITSSSGGPNFVLTQNIGSDPTVVCLNIFFPSQTLNIDLGGFTVTGNVTVGSNHPSNIIYHGTINCNISSGTCLTFGTTGRIHHITTSNANAAPLANINLTGTASAASGGSPLIRVDHVTSTVVAAPNANRTRNIMDDGANGTNPNIISLPLQADHNLITCLAGASACQGVEMYFAPNNLVQNNFFVLPATCPSCNDSPRGIIFDNNSTGDASFNTFLVLGNRGIRVRAGGSSSSLTVNLHDNDFQQIGSPGRFAAIHAGENDSSIETISVNVYNNHFELSPSGNGVVSAAATNVTVHDNNVTCFQNNCSGVGFLAETEIPSLLYGSSGTTILLNNNNVAPLTSAGLPALMVCGQPGNILYQCAAGSSAGTTLGAICNSGTAVGNGTITLFNPPCPANLVPLPPTNLIATPGA